MAEQACIQPDVSPIVVSEWDGIPGGPGQAGQQTDNLAGSGKCTFFGVACATTHPDLL